MNAPRSGFFDYAPWVLFGVLIVTALLVAAGPSLGGPFADTHANLRDMLTGDDRPIADRLAATTVVPPTAPVWTLPAMAVPAVPLLPTPWPALTRTLTQTASLPCVSFKIQGVAILEPGRLSFGRFNLVSDTHPQGRSDPLASWKLVQLESLPLPAEFPVERPPDRLDTPLPINKTVTLLISDPFTQTPLFSARWQVAEMQVLGRRAGINALLAVNLSDIRVNNAAQSPTLEHFAQTTDGILVLEIEHTADLLQELEQGAPVYAVMRGVIHSTHCQK